MNGTRVDVATWGNVWFVGVSGGGGSYGLRLTKQSCVWVDERDGIGVDSFGVFGRGVFMGACFGIPGVGWVIFG